MVYKAVVPISGGKDSQLSLKLAIQEFGASNVLGLFCDTKWEHPLTYAHVESMRKFYGVEIVTAERDDKSAPKSVPDQVRKHKRFPNDNVRFCTSELKLAPARDFYKRLSSDQGGFQVWYGMRAAESKERAARYAHLTPETLVPPHELFKGTYPKLLAKRGVRFRLPLLDKTKFQVFDMLEDDPINPLYKAGFDRVGCFPCFAGGDRMKALSFNFDEFGNDQYKIARQLAKEVGRTFWGRGCAEKDRLPGCDVCSI